MRRSVVGCLVAVAGVTSVGAAAWVPTASASITPSASTSTATPLQAGATGALDLDLKFAPSSGDTPHALTIALPPGYLADAAVDGGACLSGAPKISAPSPCQIGSGLITATVAGVVPITTGVDFYLVPPPAAGDLAGLAIGPGDGSQIGPTAPITIRPSGDPAGVGLTIALTLPDSQAGQSLSISEVDSTFTGLRFPATCPSTPSAISVAATSYGDPTTRSASLPIAVAGCSALAYHPRFSTAVSRQGKAANITTTITQAPTESPNASVKLALPFAQLKPALSAFGLLCKDPASGTCIRVATVRAVSPDYPRPLTGAGYLVGSLNALKLELVFPAPFPLTLVGSVDLKTNVASFGGLPDFPLTSLTVALPGGTHGLFGANCGRPTGTAHATTTDQNGDRTATASSRFTIDGCSNTASGRTDVAVGKPTVSSATLRGLAAGRPSLRLTVSAGRRAKLRAVTVGLPSGLSLTRRRGHGRLNLAGVSLHGATLRSATVVKGRLVLTLRRPARTVTVLASPTAIRASAALKRARRLRLTVVAQRTPGSPATVHATVTAAGR